MTSPSPRDEPLEERLRKWAVCRLCDCVSCDRDPAGELHGHICTDGPGCVNSRERLKSALLRARFDIAEALAMIRSPS